jgi:calcineurin-like phosphoesterase family protein
MCGDTHFGHSRVLKFNSGRPFGSIEEHDEVLIKNWNETVHKKDKIIHSGDVSFYGKEKTKEIIGRLNGYKILIIGNHDSSKSVKWWYDVGFDEVCRYSFIRNGIIFSHCIEPNNNSYYNIHAHLHNQIGSGYNHDKLFCTSVDMNNFKPFRIVDILKRWNLDEYGEVKK